MIDTADYLLNVRQTARLLGVHENTVRNWADSGDLPVAQVLPSGYRRFDPHEVARLANELDARNARAVDEPLDILAEQDVCLIAITDGYALPARAIAKLPPWRAVLVARVADKAAIPIEGGTLDDLVAEARRVGGRGTLDWPPSPPGRVG